MPRQPIRRRPGTTHMPTTDLDVCDSCYRYCFYDFQRVVTNSVSRFSSSMAGIGLGACGMAMDPAKAAAAGIQFPMSQRRKRRVLFTQVGNRVQCFEICEL